MLVMGEDCFSEPTDQTGIDRRLKGFTDFGDVPTMGGDTNSTDTNTNGATTDTSANQNTTTSD